MKSYIFIIILLVFFSSAAIGQTNYYFYYNGNLYSYSLLPNTTWEELTDYIILDTNEKGDTAIKDDGNIIWVVQKK